VIYLSLAVFYFISITGAAPSVVTDGEGRMPHQRPEAVEVLKNAFRGSLPNLLGFFDKVFSAKLAERFASARDMATRLESLVETHKNPAKNETADDLKIILSALNNAADVKLANTRQYTIKL
jgi:hypothetical protein